MRDAFPGSRLEITGETGGDSRSYRVDFENDPTKATCQCALVKRGPSFTFGGDCKTDTCGKTIWSGAHTTVGGSDINEAMKRVGQPLVLPPPCPT